MGIFNMASMKRDLLSRRIKNERIYGAWRFAFLGVELHEAQVRVSLRYIGISDMPGGKNIATGAWLV